MDKLNSKPADKAHAFIRGGALPLWCSLLLAAMGGVATALAFVPFDWSCCVWFSLMPLLAVLWTGHRGFWGCFGHGWVFGLFYFGVTFWWVNCVGELFEAPWLLFFCGAFVPFMSYLALYPALWAGIVGRWLRPPHPPLPAGAGEKGAWREWSRRDMMGCIAPSVGAAALWTVMEWLRGWVLTGFGWNGLGVALYPGLSLAQWAEWVGVTSLSFLPVLANAVFWCSGRRVLVTVLNAGRACRPWDFYVLVLLMFLLVTGGVLMSWRYAAESVSGREGARKLPVMAVQCCIPQKERFRMPPEEAYALLLRETERGIAEAPMHACAEAVDSGRDTSLVLPVWVVWPESSLGYPVAVEEADGRPLSDGYNARLLFGAEGVPRLRRQVKELGGKDFVLLTGADTWGVAPRGNDWERRSVWNSLGVFEDGFSSFRRADKQHLVPFGEYIPLRDACPVLVDIYASMTGTGMGVGMLPGKGDSPLTVIDPGTGGTVGVIPAVCYEDTLGRQLRRFARPGAQVIVNVTNDGWFLRSSAGRQHARNAAFRAIELRRPLIRAANTGLTAAFASNGAVIGELRDADGSPFGSGALLSELPIEQDMGLTLYARAGDWAVAACLLLAALCCRANARRRRLQASS